MAVLVVLVCAVVVGVVMYAVTDRLIVWHEQEAIPDAKARAAYYRPEQLTIVSQLLLGGLRLLSFIGFSTGLIYTAGWFIGWLGGIEAFIVYAGAIFGSMVRFSRAFALWAVRRFNLVRWMDRGVPGE